MNFVDKLIKNGYLKSPEIIQAFRKINRSDFLPDKIRDQAEIDAPLSIGYGQTISQPSTVAFMLELLQPQKGDKILEVGAGSGWQTALLAEIVGGNGSVISIERIKELKKFAQDNCRKYNFIKSGIIKIFYGDGSIGMQDQAPFDKIIVAAAYPDIPPELMEQLKINGRLVMPVGEYGFQEIVLLKKKNNLKFEEEKYPGFIFVPLIREYD